jgi:hypothetical protein
MIYLDYAVYGGGAIIVPLIMLAPLGIIEVLQDEDAGKCRIVNKIKRSI